MLNEYDGKLCSKTIHWFEKKEDENLQNIQIEMNIKSIHSQAHGL